MNHIPTKCLTVNYIDRNPLNCCKSNLHLVNRRTKSINRSIGKNNTSGTVGVYYDQCKDCWVATWNCEYGSRNVEVFTVYRYGFEHTRELALKERARIEQELPHYATVLWVNANEPDFDDNDFDDNFDDYFDDDHQ